MMKRLTYLLGMLCLSWFCLDEAIPKCSAENPIEDRWHYLLRKPAPNWMATDFDDAKWRRGFGGFGTRNTPGARIGTQWNTPNIWLRKDFVLESIPAKPALFLHHDEDVEVYLNGSKILTKRGYTTEYIVVPIDASQHSLLKKGSNLLAVHCKQTGGGQFIDVHVIDANAVPKLPVPQVPETPFQTELMTTWGAEVTPENAWREYPRPQLKRDSWTNLNGMWNYTITSADEQMKPKDWKGQILVPFCLESKLGKVGRLLFDNEALWYHRTFDASPIANQRTLLHFEAVDYRCEAFVNGTAVGKHVGGSTPFSFDITEVVKSGTNELVLRVEDDTMGFQLQGKQRPDPHGIWYTQVSGIWQTVWMEHVAETYIEDLTISTDARAGSISVRVDRIGKAKDVSLKLTVRDGEKIVAEKAVGGREITVTVPNAKRWSPSSPHLYDLEVQLIDGNGKTIDRVGSYAGIRTVGKKVDSDGHLRMTLNDEFLFHWGPLDQGWWPDGLLTPPSEKGMLFDIEYLKEAGFNMIRKHIKVEPRLYYYHCDRLGMMVWQDQVSGAVNPPWTRLAPNPVDATWPDEAHQQYMLELERMIDHLESHPSIVSWVPFNEAWGQHRTMEVGKWVSERDPSRLNNIASGGNFWPVGDIVDEHSYPDPAFPFGDKRWDGFIKVVGEFGGHGFPVMGHLWDNEANNWGYGTLPKTEAEYRERYDKSLNKLIEMKKQGIAAGVYTQTTDVEGEVNGLMTYDRKVIKIPAKELAPMHKVLIEK
jgi:beta-galactosidase